MQNDENTRKNAAESTCSSAGKSSGFLNARSGFQNGDTDPVGAVGGVTEPDQNSQNTGGGVRIQPDKSSVVMVACASCGTTFSRRSRPDRPNERPCCSKACASRIPRGSGTFITPDSTKAQRVRANGLVNMRYRMGWFSKPALCMVPGCTKPPRDMHHQDYSRPDHVHFVCRPHHVMVHHDPSLLANIAPFNTSRPLPEVA